MTAVFEVDDPYDELLRSKLTFDNASGFDLTAAEEAGECAAMHSLLKPHQVDIVRWAVAGGRRAIFAKFGLGKSIIQLSTVAPIMERTGRPTLIVCPLGVRHEFRIDAAKIGMRTKFVRFDHELDAFLPDWVGEVFLTNYESIRDGRLDPTRFVAISLDEAAVLRSLGTKTFQQFRVTCRDIPYRFVATATPAPNEYDELLNYADFLGVMDKGQALTRFFKRNSSKAGDLTLMEHRADEFWAWVSTWAVFVQAPSDLGYSDNGYDLPDLDVRWHEIAADALENLTFETRGQGVLVQDGALGVVGASKVKRSTLTDRVAKAVELVAESPEDHFILWHHTEAERAAIEAALPSAEYVHWVEHRDGNPKALELYERHYSAYQYKDGRERTLFMGPGEKTVLLTRDATALFGWRKFIDASGQTGVNASVFRNEGALLSSDLISEAMAIAWLRWPGERLYTYVDPSEVASPNPGYCFKVAGWRHCGRTKGGLDVLEVLPGDVDVFEVTPRTSLSSVYGSLDLDIREERVIGFADGESRLLATKPVLSGSGCNFQRHCHRAIFVGIDFKFADFIQAIHRIHRFGQTVPVRIDIIHADTERQVVAALKRRWAQHEELTARMSEIIREHGLAAGAMAEKLARSIGTERVSASGEGWEIVHDDTVRETRRMADASVDLIVTSPPYGTQYEYVAAVEDFGHNSDNDGFWAQMDHLTPELLRVLKPGRMCVFHTKDRVRFGNVTGHGCATVQPFGAEAIFHMIGHGFLFLGEITLTTDVVRENNQTNRLTWSEVVKDRTKLGVGIPEKILLFRKPHTDRTKGYADDPVVHTKDDYTLARWQIDASAYWRSSGDRFITPDELEGLPVPMIRRVFADACRERIYDYEAHVRIGEDFHARGRLPTTFALLEAHPHGEQPGVWTDVNRMQGLNTKQAARGAELHVCPFPFDVVDRVINQWSNPGDLVFDPFGGLGTTVVRALELGRRGKCNELNPTYWADAVAYAQAAERKVNLPSLFDLLDEEAKAS